MLKAAGLPTGFDGCLFEKALGGADVKGLLESASKVGGGGGGGGAAPAAAAAAPAGGKAAAPAAAAKKAPEPEPEEDMGFSLFD
jgi:ribosomal protein L12E/L44/L45/RPP1/RPP2